jgi:hypothetical protein
MCEDCTQLFDATDVASHLSALVLETRKGYRQLDANWSTQGRLERGNVEVMGKHAEYIDKCRHYNGIGNDAKCCGAGVRYKDVRDDSGPGMYRWPCLKLLGQPAATTACEKRSLLTPEEHDAREDEPWTS